mmetsp:Transcript_11622/g.38221  ORF Transcript_11622/g.38221 Transcript_11622/m.38221 type:complete len:216 (-) Transcript_11622:5944-6591(-)
MGETPRFEERLFLGARAPEPWLWPLQSLEKAREKAWVLEASWATLRVTARTSWVLEAAVATKPMTFVAVLARAAPTDAWLSARLSNQSSDPARTRTARDASDDDTRRAAGFVASGASSTSTTPPRAGGSFSSGCAAVEVDDDDPPLAPPPPKGEEENNPPAGGFCVVVCGVVSSLDVSSRTTARPASTDRSSRPPSPTTTRPSSPSPAKRIDRGA